MHAHKKAVLPGNGAAFRRKGGKGGKETKESEVGARMKHRSKGEKGKTLERKGRLERSLSFDAKPSPSRKASKIRKMKDKRTNVRVSFWEKRKNQKPSK
jgi:hypothetical protein